MQPAQQVSQAVHPGVALGAMLPSEMAAHLRRVSGPDALCFARAMEEGSAWANEAWGAFWAEVVRVV